MKNYLLLFILISLINISCVSKQLPYVKPTINEILANNYQAQGTFRFDIDGRKYSGRCIISSTSDRFQLLIYTSIQQLLVAVIVNKDYLFIEDRYNNKKDLHKLNEIEFPISIRLLRQILFGVLNEDIEQIKQIQPTKWQLKDTNYQITIEDFKLVKNTSLPYYFHAMENENSITIKLNTINFPETLTINNPPNN